jgi:hypothetical protein
MTENAAMMNEQEQEKLIVFPVQHPQETFPALHPGERLRRQHPIDPTTTAPSDLPRSGTLMPWTLAPSP